MVVEVSPLRSSCYADGCVQACEQVATRNMALVGQARSHIDLGLAQKDSVEQGHRRIL